MFWFTADEHYDHGRIIEYCHRPFADVAVMNAVLIDNHNRVVRNNDITIHAGDFGFFDSMVQAQGIIRELRGNHIFLNGSHDRWLPESAKFMWRKMINDQFVVVCHYAMRTWERAHHGSWQLYGHSHGTLPPIGKQWDVGVDNNNFMPVSFDQISEIMKHLPVAHGPEHDSEV